jgi:micrococcal nuclease
MIEPTILRQGTRMSHPSCADLALISRQPHGAMPPRTSGRRLTSWCACADLPSRTAAARRHCRVSAWMGFVLLLSLALVGCTQPRTEGPPVDGEPVVVRYVVDGDTVELEDGRTVRYIGINAPERHQPYYKEATDANRRLVEGETARMVLDAQQTDRFGRTLAYLWVGERFVNPELVRLGHATAYTEPPNVRYSAEIVAAEQRARNAQAGLWESADVPVRIRTIVYDAPGPDDQNPNGEWVELVIDGSQPVDLGGFTVKDEANHIYVFPVVRLNPGQRLRLHSGPGGDDASLYWGLVDDAVWNNGGDTAYLRDPQGRLVDVYEY